MKFSAIRQRIRELKWPFDTTGTIAFFALLVSAVQLIVTAPMLSALFVSPELIVSGAGQNPKADSLESMYLVTNEGNAPATKIEVGIGLQIDQRLIFLPNLVTNTVEEKNPALVKNIRIEIERLLPGEHMLIIALPGKDGNRLDPGLADFMVKTGIKEFPSISYVRSAEGVGKIKHEAIKKTQANPQKK